MVYMFNHLKNTFYRFYGLIFLLLFAVIITPCVAIDQNQDNYIQALGSLTFHTKIQSRLDETNLEESVIFDEQEALKLWELAFQTQASLNNQVSNAFITQLYQAYSFYEEGKSNLQLYQLKEAALNFKQSFNLLCFLWETAIDQEEKLDLNNVTALIRAKQTVINQDFEKNKAIPQKVRRAIAPYLIADNHPMKNALDTIFLKKRVTVDKKTFHANGFKTLRKGPRSYVYVARHPSINGYLVKAYMDNELDQKQNHPSWYWLTKRCEGAEKIARIIANRKIRHFTVASKWIYPLPENPAPPKNASHTRHYALLLVNDMDLVPHDVNLQVWQSGITKEHLHELYVIITHAKGSSYRPDNIAYTHKGQFAFIDTEYPSKGPDYDRIRKYLSPEMRTYWDRLVKNGGR